MYYMYVLCIHNTEFRECFYLNARNGSIRTLDELSLIMRSLGMSPTIAELRKYLKDKGNKAIMMPGIFQPVHKLILYFGKVNKSKWPTSWKM